jgi:hypothetical protein
MMPRIHAKFRKRYGVPYAIEQLSGKQFRCRHCNEVYFSERELQQHISNVVESGGKSNRRPSLASPALSSSVMMTVFYTYDITDRLKKEWLKMKPGEIYDGI